MNSNTTEELLVAIAYSFLFGVLTWLLYQICFSVYKVLLNMISNLVYVLSGKSHKTMTGSFRLLLKISEGRTFSIEPFNVIYILIISLLNSVYNFVMLDGIFRVLPLAFMLSGFFIMQCLTPKRVKGFLSKCSSYLSVIFVLPIDCILRLVLVIWRKIIVICRFISNKAKNQPAISKNTK